jgi:hypothetical protein
MTKKEKAALNSKRCIAEKDGTQYIISFCTTHGELLALKHALEAWKTAVGMDLDNALTRAAKDMGIEL